MVTEPAVATSFKTKGQSSARRDLLELAVGYLLIMATIWTPNPTQRVLYWLAFLWIIATTWARREGWTALGLGSKGLLPSLWIVGVALILSATAVFIASQNHTLHPLQGPTPVFRHGWAYIIWSLMQQFILQSYFLARLLRLLPGKAAPVIVAAGIFAIAHIPNPILTPVTLIWGILACALFLRYRNLYALGLAHGIMGLCIAVTVPNSIHHHMRVGLGYLRYHQGPHSLLSFDRPALSQPKRPERIHRSMGNRGSSHSPLLTPSPPVKNPRNHRKQHIAPVEVQSPLVEV